MSFSKCVQRLQESTTYKILAMLCVCFTIFSAFRLAAIWLNLIPGYYLEWHRIDSLEPIINLFPGEQIGLDMEFYDSFPRKNISSASWKVIRGNDVIFNEDGLEPTFTLPPTEGGIYKLQVEATTIVGSKRKGESAFYVIQDKPKTKRIHMSTSVKLTPQDTNPSLLKNIQSNGAEVYSGNGRWTAIKVLKTNDGVNLSFKPNEDISLYGDNNKLLFRSKNEINKLSSYGSAHFPIKSPDSINKRW
ncbi:MAG: hypothetical protein K2X50_07665 [Gammaproteobacteria bacterium]|nr:hypothetical protein [Gammaproteobacteria bacterium]